MDNWLKKHSNNPSEGPRRNSSYYYRATQLAHRTQAALRRFKADPDFWRPGLRVLCYHRISRDRDELSVHPDLFRLQMELILEVGVTPVSLDSGLDLLKRSNRSNAVPPRILAITFDDGYRDNLENAVPVLEELDIPATISVVSKFASRQAWPSWYDVSPPTLNWDEILDLSKSNLFSIGAHTLSHPSLIHLADQQAWTEIAESKRDLEERTGQPISTFTYPYGLFSKRDVLFTKNAGFRSSLTCIPGTNDYFTPTHELKRILIDHFDSLKLFEAKVRGHLDSPWGLPFK